MGAGSSKWQEAGQGTDKRGRRTEAGLVAKTEERTFQKHGTKCTGPGGSGPGGLAAHAQKKGSVNRLRWKAATQR